MASKDVKDLEDEVAAKRAVPSASPELARAKPAKRMAARNEGCSLVPHHTNTTLHFSPTSSSSSSATGESSSSSSSSSPPNIPDCSRSAIREIVTGCSPASSPAGGSSTGGSWRSTPSVRMEKLRSRAGALRGGGRGKLRRRARAPRG